MVTAFAFATTPGSPGGRGILSASFLLWGAERAILGFAYLRYRDVSAMPEPLQYAYFLEMFLEMTIGVGIIILLFEASQVQLQEEMQKLVESDSQAKEMGIRDRLTGLYNRHYFNDVIRRELAQSRRHGTALSVLLIDVDRFKEINDVRGHQIGDEVLQFVANYLTACLRESDLVFRWGGDEFLILLSHSDEASAAQKAEEIGAPAAAHPGRRAASADALGRVGHAPAEGRVPQDPGRGRRPDVRNEAQPEARARSARAGSGEALSIR